MTHALKNLMLLLVTLLFCMGAAELIARLVLPASPVYRAPQPVHDQHPSLGWVLRPNQEAFTHDKPLRINAAGVRDDDELPDERREGEKRILVVGDSVTFGNGVETSETYSEVLEALLQAEGFSVRAINSGVQGYDIHQEAEALLERGFEFDPDIVVVGFYENDVALRSSAARYRAKVDADGEFAGAGIPGLPHEFLYALKRFRSFIYLRTLLRELRWGVFPPEGAYHIRAIFFDEPSPESERAWEDVTESLETMRDAARAHAVPIVLAIFPHHGQMTDGAPVHTYQGRLHEIADVLGLPTVDLLDPFRAAIRRGERPFIPYDAHPTALGHRLAAEALQVPVAEALRHSLAPPSIDPNR